MFTAPVRRVAGGRPEWQRVLLDQSGGWIPALAISRDGRWAAVSTDVGTVLCDMPSGEPVFAWALSGSRVEFAPDGTQLLVSGKSGTILVPIPSAALLAATASKRVTRRASPAERARFGL